MLGITMAAALAATLAACSSPPSTTKPPATHPAIPAAVATTAAPATSAPAAAASGLSGAWSGQYSGAYTGTFNLHWTQSGQKLGGMIMLSTPAVTLRIHGTVQGGSIKFGTVGSTNITYSGSVSGNSMSGTYQVVNGNGSSGGPWSATKS
ncbi:MAG TPA: hypothetical protein VGS19_04185 [Streptosporangiaceae bacterium]|nr:hypothetical protein [Streptosporangiaceae bacterium]